MRNGNCDHENTCGTLMRRQAGGAGSCTLSGSFKGSREWNHSMYTCRSNNVKESKGLSKSPGTGNEKDLKGQTPVLAAVSRKRRLWKGYEKGMERA